MPGCLLFFYKFQNEYTNKNNVEAEFRLNLPEYTLPNESL